MKAESYERIPSPEVYSGVVQGIKANAEATIEELAHLTDFAFRYNRESVAWLEGYIERMRAVGVFNGPAREKLISVFGSFLGECIARTWGGSWKQRDGAWGIAFDHEHMALPFAAVASQLECGWTFGIGKYFDIIPIEFIGCVVFRPTRDWPTARGS